MPYVNEEAKRDKPFTSSMEKAAQLCLAEARRRKSGILGGIQKEIDFIVKMQYPFWFVLWGDRCVIVDGLGLSSTTISHDQMPNIVDFTEDLIRSSCSFNLFQKTLKKHLQTFREFTSKKEEIIKNIIGDREVLQFFSSFIGQTIPITEASKDDAALIPPLSPEEAKKNAEELIEERQALGTEIAALRYALDMLKKEGKYHEEKISIEIEQIWRDYEKRIFEMEKITEKRTAQMVKEKDKEIITASKMHERKMNAVFKEEAKLRQKIEKLRRVLEEHLKKRERLRRRYPKRERTRLDSRIEFYKEEVEELSERIRDLSKLREDIRKEGEKTLKAIEEKYLSMVAKEMEKIEVLKESRNLEVSKRRDYLRELEDDISTIEAQLKRLTERKLDSLKMLEELTLPWKLEETTLVGMPFYLVQYKTPQKTVVEIYPPVTATSYEGIIRKIQRVIFSFNLESRIRLLLNPRSAALNRALFVTLRESVKTNDALREKLTQIGKARNLLKSPNFKEEIRKGLEELEAEGWINAQEKNDILGIYVS